MIRHRREYHDSTRGSSLLECYQELTLPTLTGHSPFIMVSELLKPLAPSIDQGIPAWLVLVSTR